MQVVVVVTIVVSVVVGSHSSLSVYWVVPTHFLLVSFKCFDKVREILDAVTPARLYNDSCHSEL